jgi:hypothetical protein
MADENPSDFQCDCGGEVEIVKDVLNTPNTLPKTSATFKTHKPLKTSENTKQTKLSKNSGSSDSIFEDWKKQYIIVIATSLLIFGLIAADSAGFFPDIVLTNLTVPSTGVSGGEITMPTIIENKGFITTNDFNVTFQFAPEKSPKNVIFLGKIRMSKVAGGKVKSQNTKFTIPSNIKPGQYFIRVVVDSDKEIYESNEDNDFYSSKQVTIIS